MIRRKNLYDQTFHFSGDAINNDGQIRRESQNYGRLKQLPRDYSRLPLAGFNRKEITADSLTERLMQGNTYIDGTRKDKQEFDKPQFSNMEDLFTVFNKSQKTRNSLLQKIASRGPLPVVSSTPIASLSPVVSTNIPAIPAAPVAVDPNEVQFDLVKFLNEYRGNRAEFLTKWLSMDAKQADEVIKDYDKNDIKEGDLILKTPADNLIPVVFETIGLVEFLEFKRFLRKIDAKVEEAQLDRLRDVIEHMNRTDSLKTEGLKDLKARGEKLVAVLEEGLGKARQSGSKPEKDAEYIKLFESIADDVMDNYYSKSDLTKLLKDLKKPGFQGGKSFPNFSKLYLIVAWKLTHPDQVDLTLFTKPPEDIKKLKQRFRRIIGKDYF